MGIFGLFTYMKNNCKNGFEKVNLEEIAKKYRMETGKEPVILVDISSCVTFFAGQEFLKNTCGNLRVYKRNLETFLSNCSKIGIHVCFIGEGMKPLSKCQEWITKKRYELKRNTKMNDKMVQQFYYQFHFGVFLSASPSLVNSLQKFEYIRALYEADEFGIRFAKQHGCFAVLTNDSDFVLAEGFHYCLSVRDLEVDTMFTYNFNRNNLAKHLNISPSSLPIFAALLQPFLGAHFKIRLDVFSKFNNLLHEQYHQIARSIKNCPVKEGNEEIFEYLINNVNPGKASKFRDSFNFYAATGPENGYILTGSRNWDNIMIAAKERHVAVVSDKNLLEILLHRVYFKSELCPWQRNSFDITLFDLAPLRKKMYGIIFFECPDSEVSVTEYTANFKRPQNKIVVKQQEVRFPRIFHRGLLELWAKDSSKERIGIRRKLFCRTLHEGLTPEILDEVKLPEELIFPALAICMMIWETNGNLTDFELTLLLTETILAYKLKDRDLLLYPSKIDLSAVKTSEMFLLTLSHLKLLNSICGEPFSLSKIRRKRWWRADNTSPGFFLWLTFLTTSYLNYYDGNLFQIVYHEVTIGVLPGNNFEGVDTMSEFEDFKDKVHRLLVLSKPFESKTNGSIMANWRLAKNRHPL